MMVSSWEWNKIDPQFEAFAKKGCGYAFFPEISKGGFVVGGAHGRGVVYEKGQHTTAATKAANAKVLADLPFSDKRDFENARRGFIVKP